MFGLLRRLLCRHTFVTVGRGRDQLQICAKCGRTRYLLRLTCDGGPCDCGTWDEYWLRGDLRPVLRAYYDRLSQRGRQ